MNQTQTPKTPDISSVSQNTENVDHTRRKIASAGLGGSAVLITLASRPVLGATCLTPSAAGSGNHSQHNPITAGCAPLNVADWLSLTPKKSNGQIDTNNKWLDTNYTPGTLFHSESTGFTATTLFEYMDGDGINGTSFTLYEVLSGRKINNGGEDQGPLTNFTDPNNIGPWFVAGLLNAAANKYGGVIKTIGPDPSVRGIEDEYARQGFFVPTAGKKWYYDTIIAYLNDPGSVF